jgi:hypothetical protein
VNNLCRVLEFTVISDVGFMCKLKGNNLLGIFLAYMVCFASSILLLRLHNKLTIILFDLDIKRGHCHVGKKTS